jgi:hypothetical protein
MRYSLGLLFAAMAYASLVAGAFVSSNRALSGIVWAATAMAFCYAAATLCYARGKRQALALGFVLLSAIHFAAQCFLPNQTPAEQLFRALGYFPTSGYLRVLSDPPIIQLFSADRISPDRMIVNGDSALSTANGVGAMLSGLLGALVGAAAYKHSKRE